MYRHIALSLLVMMPAATLRADDRTPLPKGWQLQPAETASASPVADKWADGEAVPSAWKRTLSQAKLWPDLCVDAADSLWYRQTLAIPATWEGQRILLDFHRIEGDAIVFCNDQRIGELLRPGGEIELTKAIRFGSDNVLRVFVTRAYTDISRDFEHDALRYGTRGPKARDLPMKRWGLGISAPVDLVRRPVPAAIVGAFARPSWRMKRLAVDVDIQTTEAVADAHLEVTVTDADGATALTTTSQPLNLPAGASIQTLDINWAEPIPWELEAPYLYTLSVRLAGTGGTLDTLPEQRFGFREIWTEGRHIYLNGHVSRWRMEWTNFGINANSISLLKLLGRNVLYAQNSPSAWWSDWSESPYYGDTFLNLLDESGIGLLLPAPSVSTIRDLLLRDEAARADFQRETALWVRRHRNHPCILAWCLSMNSFCPRDGIHPDTMGQRQNYSHRQAKVIEDAAAIIKSFDPTRLAYGHADGNLTDIATANVYPNFSPLQEVEDWPEMWAAKGDMPYIAAEYALPYNGSFYNKTQFLGTEFAAMYFGDEAYRQETEDLLRQTVAISMGNKGHGNSIGQAIPNFPMYWTLRELYVTHSDRAWRTWGVLAWHYFNFGQGYGDPPGVTVNKFSRYAGLKEPVTERPDWANPNFDMHSVAMQPLLAYLAGAPEFTDKTHAYYSGDTIRKQVAIVWDGPGSRSLQAQWSLRQDNAVIATQTVDLALNAGDTTFVPIVCTAPQVQARAELVLDLSITENGAPCARDTFALQVFPPRDERLSLNAKIAIWDPKGRTGDWLATLGVPVTAVTPGTALADYDLLLIGREALTPGAQLPHTPADIERGLRVIIFAQQPAMWEALGFLPDDLMTRYVFPCADDNPILDGLQAVDLRDWRGSPDLVPAFRRTYGHNAQRAPRSSNRGTVASVVLRLPDAVGFTPLLNAEFDLDYSPLLHWRYGRGAIYFCSLDLDDRVGIEPAATRLAVNLLRTAAAPAPATVPQVRIIRPSDPLDAPADLDAAQQGECVLVLPRPSADLKAAGFVVEPIDLYRAPVPAGPLFTAVGPRLLRWRDALTVDAFAAQGQPEGCTVVGNGLFMVQQLGSGRRLFIQAGPELLESRYADDPGKRAAMRLSVFRLRQLTAQFLTNAGVEPDLTVATRICELRAGPAYESLDSWHVLGPFFPAATSPAAALATVFPGEANAIAGDTNPNFTYKRDDDKLLDFRTTVTAGPTGFIDLDAALKPNATAVAYVTRTVNSETDREAILRLGVDYFMQVWVNGDTVYRLTSGHGAPQALRHQLKVALKQGENTITIKIRAGSNGFGFWADLSTANANSPTDDSAPPVSLYPADIGFFDPYEYHYW